MTLKTTMGVVKNEQALDRVMSSMAGAIEHNTQLN
jgi:hypothetical protein